MDRDSMISKGIVKSRLSEKKILKETSSKLRQQKIQNLKNYVIKRGNLAIKSGDTFRKLLVGKSSFKAVKKRETGTKNLLKAIGALPSASSTYGGSGPGRPKRTFKYGIPIDQYKKLQSQRSALYKQYSQQQNNQLASRGLTAQQVQQLQAARTVQNQPMQMQSQVQVDKFDTVADEVEFQRYLAQNTVSPNTQNILDNLKRTQNKAITDDINQQRVHRERKLINEQQSLLKARNLFGPDSNRINPFDDQNNILKAENVFALSSGINILQTGRANIMDTTSTGNTLRFF